MRKLIKEIMAHVRNEINQIFQLDDAIYLISTLNPSVIISSIKIKMKITNLMQD